MVEEILNNFIAVKCRNLVIDYSDFNNAASLIKIHGWVKQHCETSYFMTLLWLSNDNGKERHQAIARFFFHKSKSDEKILLCLITQKL